MPTFHTIERKSHIKTSFHFLQATNCSMNAPTPSFPSYRPLQNPHLYSNSTHSSSLPMIRSVAKYLSSNRQHLHLFKTNRATEASRCVNMRLNAVNLPPVPSVPSWSSFPGWTSWVLLSVIPILIPLFTGEGKLGSYKVLKNRVDSAVDTVETIVEQIEDVAEVVDKIADEVVEHLPESSKLRNIVKRIDDIAEKTVKVADCAEDILHKVNDVGDAVEALLDESSKSRVAVATKKLNSDMDQVAVATDKMKSDVDEISVSISQVRDEEKGTSKDVVVVGTTTVAVEGKKE